MFNIKDPISIIKFLATFRFACVTKNIHDGVGIGVLPHFVHEKLTNTPNSYKYAEDSLASFAALVRNQKQ